LNRLFALFCLAWVLLPLCAKEAPRPKIGSIGLVMVKAQDEAKSEEFYHRLARILLSQELDLRSQGLPILPVESYFPIGSSKAEGKTGENLLGQVGFVTDNAEVLREWIRKNGYPVGDLKAKFHMRSFSMTDPAGLTISFSEFRNKTARGDVTPNGTSGIRLIHAGWVVRNRATMDKFYKDVLGFRVYWHGGMKDGDTDWVDMQVPDGTDWVEFMLNVPENADKQTLGAVNHVAIGVPDVRMAAKALESHGMKLRELPQIGRDGKWQLNLYDPDGTRVELMEFTPVEKPCCAQFTGPHPEP
jgi:catechol 2,3-dioxygenase-like lactoylglutathione lyase family enzyme